MDTLGVVEARSIASGALLADGMVKVAQVALRRASSICSGRYLIIVSGDREAVATSVRHALESGRPLSGSFVIANVSEQVGAALEKSASASDGEALAVIECRTVSSGIAAADSAVKRSAVRLLRLVTGQGINGKSYFVLGGDVAAVSEAAQAAEAALGNNLVEAVVIPRPEPAVGRALTSGVR
jgi:microcompartment protein CcmL/EutN